MVPAAVTLKRSKTASIILVAVATIIAALWLAPRGAPRRSVVVGVQPPGDPCELAISSRLTSTHVMVGQHEEHLVVTLKAPSCGQNLVRPPMSIAVVLDRSGSMAPATVPTENQPLTHAKRAAIALIDQLEPTDAFSVITYSVDAEVVTAMMLATPDAKLAARRAVEAISADGGTNISAGLELGRGQLQSSPIADGVRRVVLISDGDANEGVYSRDGLARIAANIAEGGTSITAVGLGLEYNEMIMTDIAAAGRGNYYFVEDTARLGEMFTAEISSAGKTVAADAELALDPASGVEMLEVFGYGAHLEGSAWLVPVADLAAGETRKIVVRVRVNADAGGAMDLATARLSYRPIDAHQRRTVTATARAEVTGDAKVVRAGLDTTTVQLVEEAETAQAIDQAAIVYQHEGYDGARKVLDARMAAARAAAADLGDDEIADKSIRAARQVKENFAAAPAASGMGGLKATKGASKTAYDLAK